MAKDDIIQLFDEYYDESYTAWGPFYELAANDLRFYLGDQWNLQEKKALLAEGRNASVFNRIKRNIDMVTGYQRKNRLSSNVNPIENSDQLTADQFSQLLLYSYQYDDGYNTVSDCFSGAVKTGWNLASVYLDYVDDPKDGSLRICREPFSAFITDPYFTKLDLSDCGYIIKRKYISPSQALSLLPGMEKDILDLTKQRWERDNKFSWLPYQRNPDGQEMVAYDEFYQQKWKNISMIVDMETGEFTEWDGDSRRLNIIKKIYPNLEIVKKPKRYIERNIIINNQLVKTEINPYGLDEYPFVPFIAIFEPESDDWGLKVQSLVRCQIDPQRESNRRRSQMSDILDSQINSGWIADEDSVINPDSLFQTSQGKVIWRKRDAKPGALEKIPPSQIPPSMFQLQEMYDRDMPDIMGINDAAFGIPESRNESGLMMMLRQSAAIQNLQSVFDNLRLSQKILSKKMLKLIQTWTPQKVERILKQKPSEQFYSKNFEKYDITVSEGLLTDSQKMVYFRQLLDLKQLTDVPSQSPITADMLIDAAPVQGKSTLIEQIKQNQQSMAQAQQQQSEIQQQLMDSQRQMSQAKAISELALSKERFTRAVANMGLEDERASKAVSDRSDATLSRIKAIKEIQDMDDTRLFRYMAITKMMDENSQREEEQIKSDDVVISKRASEDTQQQLQEQAVNEMIAQYTGRQNQINPDMSMQQLGGQL